MGREATPEIAELRRLAAHVAAGCDCRDAAELDARIAQLEHRVDGLIDTLLSRDVIGQAKGVLMSHLAVDADAAFERLRELSRVAGVEVAELSSAFVGQVRAHGPACAEDRRAITELLDQLAVTVPARTGAGLIRR
ncbi:ANTAR domain-containing protein [Actinomycetospora sp.]|jgi:hypothetical protein|uniref:ANTAR domain-containing protein n=1 Tax=Actinomycetospora sp. TaxID=1872135 RepID=UPI002F424658